MPENPNFEWTRCINADSGGKDIHGNPHFPCQVCEWKLKAPATTPAQP